MRSMVTVKITDEIHTIMATNRMPLPTGLTEANLIVKATARRALNVDKRVTAEIELHNAFEEAYCGHDRVECRLIAVA